MINTKFGSVVISGMEEGRRKQKEGKVDIGKGSEVAFIVFVDFFLKLVAAAWVCVISASIPTYMFEIVHKN